MTLRAEDLIAMKFIAPKRQGQPPHMVALSRVHSEQSIKRSLDYNDKKKPIRPGAALTALIAV